MTATESGRVDWKFMLPLVLGNMMNPLNSTMLVTALGTICHHFSQDVSSGALLVTPLYIAATIGQPLMGRLADMYDPKTINKFGIFIVLLAAIIGVMAPTFEWLIVSRVFFGIGTSAAYPSTMTMVAHKYGHEGKTIPGNILGIITLSSQVSLVLGPLLGGLLTQVLGWQGIFWINIPWTLLTLYLLKNITSVPRPAINISFVKKTDLFGILIFSVLLVFLLLAFIQHNFQWLYIIITIVSFASLIIWELNQENPFIDVRLLWNTPALLSVYARTLATSYVLYLLIYAMPQWVEVVKKMSPAQTGLIILPMTFMSGISAILISRSKNITFINVAAIFSMLLTCACMFLFKHTMPVWEITAITLLAGTAMGINIVANQASLSAEAPSDKTGISFGLYRTFGYLGAIISGTQLKTLFHEGVNDRSIYLCSIYAAVACIGLILLYFNFFKRIIKN